jgi:hypothetical protein
MEELFSNPSSPVPDELWKSPSVQERQLAAVAFWADLKGLNKEAADKAPLIRRIRDLAAHPDAPARATAAIMGTLAAGEHAYDVRKKPQDKEIEVAPGVFTSNPTKRQLALREDRAVLRERLERGSSSKIRSKLQDTKERVAQLSAENRALSTLAAGLVGAGTAYGFTRRMHKVAAARMNKK